MNERQRRFVAEYLKDPNFTQAAIAAGYSPKSARNHGRRLMQNDAIASLIAEGQKSRAEDVQVDALWVLKDLLNSAGVDIADLVDPVSGEMRTLLEMPDALKKRIAGIEVVELLGPRGKKQGYTHKIKLLDRTRIIELIGKHIDVGALRERIKVEREVTLVLRDYTGLSHEILQEEEKEVVH